MKIFAAREKGFTLIELLLVVVIMGLMLSVIVPRSQRAAIDAKYSLVRQTATELGSYANFWADRQIEAQTEESSATLNAYFLSLTTSQSEIILYDPASKGARNSFLPAGSNWTTTSVNVVGRTSNPEVSVQGTITPDKTPRNPFNGASFFSRANDGTTAVVPGALSMAVADNNGWNYFAFIYHGTDSLTPDQFHAGQGDGSDLVDLRNGIFMARAR